MEIRQKAKEVALAAIEDQKRDFQEWGIMGDWENAYRTLGTTRKQHVHEADP